MFNDVIIRGRSNMCCIYMKKLPTSLKVTVRVHVKVIVRIYVKKYARAKELTKEY